MNPAQNDEPATTRQSQQLEQAAAPSAATAVVHSDDDRRSRRRQRRRQSDTVESRYKPQATPSTAPVTAPGDLNVNTARHPSPKNDHFKSELYIMSDKPRRHSDSRQGDARPGDTFSRSPPDSKRTISRPVTMSTAQTLIPTSWQEPTERTRKRSGGKMAAAGPVTSPSRDKRHSLNSPTVPITGGLNFLTVIPPSEMRVSASPPGGTRAAIHIIDDFLHNPPPPPPPRQRSLSRNQPNRGSGKREHRQRKVSRSQVTVGLDHLDNLCRLMEQLASLRDENTKLKKRCSFLENTRELLKIQNEMLMQERDDYDSADEDTLSLGLSESTLAGSQIMDDDDVFSHSTATPQPPSLVRTAHRRSQSVGSLDMADILPVLEQKSQFTSKFKKSFKITRNTIKNKIFGKKEGVEYSIVKSPITVVTTTPTDERISKLSQSSDHSSPSPCHSEPGIRTFEPIVKPSEPVIRTFEPAIRTLEPEHGETKEAYVMPESAPATNAELFVPIVEPSMTRDAVSDDASTPCQLSPETERQRYYKRTHPIQIDAQVLTRRKSSPTLTSTKDDMSEVKRAATPEIPRSVTTPQFSDYSPKDDKIRGRTAWGKVKDIIHTRKDSLKKRSTRKSSEDNRRSMNEAMLERKSAEPRDTGTSMDEHVSKMSSSSDTKLNEIGTTPPKPTKPKEIIPASGHDVHTNKALKELVGNLSEEFNRKMMEWERKKSDKRTDPHTSSTGSVGDRLSDLGAEPKRQPQRKISHTTSYPAKMTRSADTSFASKESAKVTLEHLQQGMTDSFNRKMLEWERMRSGQPQDGYMSVEGIRREVPWKSRSEKKTKAEKEKLRQERLREKQLVKVERECQKLERDRQRLQREQQRTIRRAVELERKKEQLEDGMMVDTGHDRKGHHSSASHHQPYPSPRKKHYKFVNVGEYQIEGLSHEFAKRMQTWEEKKHGTKECLHSWDPHEKGHVCKDVDVGDIVIPPKFKEGQPPLPIVIRSQLGMPEHLENIHTSPQIVRVEPTYQRATLCTHETQTSPQKTEGQKADKQFQFDDPITELRNRNSYLSQQLVQKESESKNLQDDVEGLNRALRRMNESYTKEIASYKHQLWASSHWGQTSEQSRFVADAVHNLRERVEQLEDIHCMEARRRPFYNGISSKVDNQRKDTPASTESCPTRYRNLMEYVKKLNGQIDDLKKGILERDDVLRKFRKHLSLEEINKLLLNADIQRRDLELQFFKKKHKHGVLRRHRTFAGQDFCLRQGCDDQSAFKTWPKYRARCVDKIPSSFRHGNFDPDSHETEPDIGDVLRTCGIKSDDISSDNHQDILNGNTAAPPRRPYRPEVSTRSIATQCGYDSPSPGYHRRYGSADDCEDYWSGDSPRYPRITLHVRRSAEPRRYRAGTGDSDRSDSDSERRSRIDYDRHHLRDKFFSSVTDTPTTGARQSRALQSGRRSNDSSLSPNYRTGSTASPSREEGKSSFKVRSATYFSPKPYNKPQNYPDEPHRLELPQSDVIRRVSPLRKLHSTSELMTERRTTIAGRYSATEVRHSSLMDRRTREEYFADISRRRSQLLQQQELSASQANIVSGVDVQSLAQTYDQYQDNEAGGHNVSAKELPREGTVRRLTEVFVSGIENTNGHSRSKISSERMTDAMQRKRSLEIPKEGTVLRRLGEFLPYQHQKAEASKVETSPTQRRRQSEIPKEGTVQKRLEELRMYSSDGDGRTGPDGKEARKSDSDDSQRMLMIGRKDTVSSTDDDFGGSSKGHSDDEPFSHDRPSGTKISHSSIRLRPQPIGQQHRDRSKRLSPMEMLVRGTVSLNLDVVSPGYTDGEHQRTESDPPLSPSESHGKRRSWFSRSFFKSQK